MKRPTLAETKRTILGWARELWGEDADCRVVNGARGPCSHMLLALPRMHVPTDGDLCLHVARLEPGDGGDIGPSYAQVGLLTVGFERGEPVEFRWQNATGCAGPPGAHRTPEQPKAARVCLPGHPASRPPARRAAKLSRRRP